MNVKSIRPLLGFLFLVVIASLMFGITTRAQQPSQDQDQPSSTQPTPDQGTRTPQDPTPDRLPDTGDEPVQPRDDQFQPRDDRFQPRDDEFQERDDRPQRQRDQFDRRNEPGQQDPSQGRTGADIDADLGATLRTNEQDQLIVSRLSQQGILVDSGIRQGDVIVSIDGRRVSSQADLQSWLRQAERGQRVPLVVMRNGQRQTIYLETPTGRFTRPGADPNLGITFRSDARGDLIVSDLASTGLFASSGLRRGDVIVAVDGRSIASEQEFVRFVRYYDGPRVPVVVLRDGQRETVYISTDDTRQTRRFRGYPDDFRIPDGDRAWLGVYLDMRYPEHAVVESVQIGSAADQAQLRAGDWIVSVNGQRVQNPSHLSRMISQMEPGEQIRMEVSRRVTADMTAQLGDRPTNFGRFRYDDTIDVYERRGFRGDADVDVYQDRDRGLFDGTFRERMRDRIDR